MKFPSSIPKEKRQLVLLIAVVSLIGVVVVSTFVIGKQLSSLRESTQRIADLKVQIQEQENKTRQAAQDKASREQKQAFVDAQLAAMVAGDPFSWVVREVSLLAEKQPVRVLSFRPGTKAQLAKKTKYEVFTTRMEIEGGYDQLGEFVAALENKFPTGEIRSLDITVADPARGKLRATAELALVIRPGPEVPAQSGKQKM